MTNVLARQSSGRFTPICIHTELKFHVETWKAFSICGIPLLMLTTRNMLLKQVVCHS